MVKPERPVRKRAVKTKGPATISDVAEAAGVSTATVSRVLAESSLVVEATRNRVLAAVASLHYAPNASATSLRRLTTDRILVIVPDIANAFFSPILQAIEEAASREGYAVLIGDAQEKPDGDTQYATMLPRRIVDGLIVLSRSPPKALRGWIEAQPLLAPVVTALISDASTKISSVNIDDSRCGFQGMDHLIGLGHRHIAVLTAQEDWGVVRSRLRGVLEVAKSRGLLKHVVVEHGEFSVESGIACAAKVLARSPAPTALFCMSDSMAVGASDFARRSGLRIPENLSILGFDDIAFAPYLNPPLTTINVPLRDIGREAMRLLLGVLQGKLTRRVVEILPHRLVIRGSTARVPAGH